MIMSGYYQPTTQYSSAPIQGSCSLDFFVRFSQEERIMFEDLSEVELSSESPFLVNGFIHNKATVIFGRPKAGKSFVSLSIAHAITTGEDWLGQPTEPRKVALWALDPGQKDEMKVRYDTIEGKPGLLITSIRPDYRPGYADEWWASFTVELLERGVTVLVIDNLTRLLPAGSSTRFDDHVEPILSRLSELIDAGITVILVHHKGKFNEEQGSQKSPMGSTAIESWGRHFVDVTNHDKGLIELRAYGNDTQEFSVFAAFDPTCVGEDGAFLTYLDREDWASEMTMHEDIVNSARKRLAEIRNKGKRTTTAKNTRERNRDTDVAGLILAVVNKSPDGVAKTSLHQEVRADNRRINSALDAMVSNGQLREWKDGRTSMYARAA
ncbi:AAA family ATPase [Micromonospora aurantiaca (nom. illeg.)]|uniref:AAA family ATPase n=1 Tax=Micromonospora aurantiaca (nom. illeg.) TaxID=47850 RepID=UPI0037AC97C6